MDRRSSPLSDMYGTEPQDESPRGGSHTWLYILVAALGFFVFESLQPVMRLRSDPPLSVVGARLNQNDSQYQSQIRMARACWDYAIESVQNVYPFGQSLPKSPPPRLNDSTGKPPALGLLCWPRLRVAWTQRESWVEIYIWNTQWVTDPDGTFQQVLHKALSVVGINY